ncbi:potassium/proton antiporter [Pontibacter chinhatensis]|uniref:Potassium/proton antiporter, CPA1 family n=1 Tax=Pontibacter chinhatensis TaxID=1436961 RepID=A0A1I2XSB9_9BACT|nr:potassium/proton antiporter [Pontibacter chinhatensis]SFH16364.1 potassium/proton antiporter, CPA1 family [Pontibacter chinhatensis]
MTVSVELVLFGVSILFFLSILAGKAGYKFGVPALLLFLSVGMLSGSDGLGIQFENIYVAQTIGTVALCIILFSGGMDTKIADIRPIMAQGVVLATFGVLVTALLTGVLIWWILGMTLPSAGIGLATALLLAATMSSTDSASVFSILRSKGLNLKNNLRPMLELESGSNDPMAYILTITLIEIIKIESGVSYWAAGGMLVMQLAIGAIAGYLLGKLAVRAINYLQIDNASLYPILVFTFCIFIFSFTYFIKGNGFLAVYIGGLVIGNSKFVHKRSSLNFFDGMAWMSQLLMFLTLGLLVNPRELVPIIIPGLLISILMIFVTRPLSVFLCLAPFRKMGIKDKLFISWVGLRGAVPIIFAILPLAEGVPHARLMFNIVFFCTLVSLVVQGTSLSKMAVWLGLADKPDELQKLKDFDVEFSDEIKSVMTEMRVTAAAFKDGNRLMDLPLPDKTLAVMVKREGKYFVPKGSTELQESDVLLLITDDQQALMETMRGMGVAGTTA